MSPTPAETDTPRRGRGRPKGSRSQYPDPRKGLDVASIADTQDARAYAVAEWLLAHDGTHADAAAALGCSKTTVLRAIARLEALDVELWAQVREIMDRHKAQAATLGALARFDAGAEPEGEATDWESAERLVRAWRSHLRWCELNGEVERAASARAKLTELLELQKGLL